MVNNMCTVVITLSLCQMFPDERNKLLIRFSGNKGAYRLGCLQTGSEFFGGSFNIDGGTGPVHQRHIIEITGCSTAGGNHHILKG
ncbi:hypothetical protein SDC9_211236 [bioreactor metagenome]|uniref:Uncharacterized protein n=1 Tax=bioreactor metagenome TaxID=1076179 RepID=A0A645JJE5_9ZZZZ